MLAAPLMLGCDVRNMNETTKSILLNKDIIAIDQDALGKQAARVMRTDGLEVWKKPLTGNRVAIAFLNRNSTSKSLTVTWKDLELRQATHYNVFEVWKHEAISRADSTISADLKSHECQVFVLSPTDSK
jgi:alpha-galactosidase